VRIAGRAIPGWLIAAAAVAAVIAAGAVLQFGRHAAKSSDRAPDAGAARAHYVGAAACASCHAREYAAWRSSQHQQAMQHAAAGTVLGDFANARFTYAGISSTFFSRDGAYFVNTDGPDGQLHDYQILYTFGITPLQQYLIALPGGRLQALSIAWDTRPKEQGGQRWFHLYPGQAIKAGDRLHWTGIDQNWNFQCADCHSTHLQKRFDSKTNVFSTTWSEINVACEACHGPASRHLDWARQQDGWRKLGNKGLEAALDERHGVNWSRAAGATTATRSTARTTSREIDTCARCHARRGQLTDEVKPGQPLADSYRPALLEEGLYWADGQMRDEVYNYGSFLQSRMYAMGVTCGDCHDPHTLRLRAPGNLVCAQCHDAAKYDAPGHSHHASGTPGAQCAACHMPTTTYMQVDARHDHSLRIPRPDRTISMGVPNACNQCHRNRDAAWADARIRSWTPLPAPGHQGFAEALHAAERSAMSAPDMLRTVVADAQQPAIARASAVALLGRYPGPASSDLLHAALRDASPLVRGAAVEALSGEPPEQRIRWLLPLASDPVRMVRIEAAQALDGIPLTDANPAERAALARATAEYLAAQQFNADRPEAHSNLGLHYARIGQQQQAQAELERALAIDPGFVPAAVNLADLYRARGEEAQAESVLRAALPASHDDASLHYSLGLSLARQERMTESLAQLQQAARLAPGDPRYAYVYGVALHSAGRPAEGIAVLAAAHARFTGDAEILQALATMERDRGNLAAARDYARQLVQLNPDDPQAHALLRELAR
jgi:predicted CXXCH cytochrome family protein